MSTLAVKSTKSSVKAKALRAVRNLPATATWDDVMYQLYVRQKIETGLSDVKSGRTHTHASIRKEFGLGA
jgi:hypothetical protein